MKPTLAGGAWPAERPTGLGATGYYVTSACSPRGKQAARRAGAAGGFWGCISRPAHLRLTTSSARLAVYSLHNCEVVSVIHQGREGRDT